MKYNKYSKLTFYLSRIVVDKKGKTYSVPFRRNLFVAERLDLFKKQAILAMIAKLPYKTL